MSEIRFTDGAGYERYMGMWSRLIGQTFIDWLVPPGGWRWLDVGCGNGAFTELLIERCAPASVTGVDPSEAQLAFARLRPGTRGAEFVQGNAMSLQFPNAAFDAAAMPLVIVFVPDPAAGVAEMVRVVRPGGTVAAYMWDPEAGGFPYGALMAEMRAMDLPVPTPPSPDASRSDMLRDLWTTAGMVDIRAREISVARTFADFAEYWTTIQLSASIGPTLRDLAASDPERLGAIETKMRELLRPDSNGRITYTSRANAIAGHLGERGQR